MVFIRLIIGQNLLSLTCPKYAYSPLSDPHIPTPLHKVPLLKWLGKRSIGGTNLILGRNRLFKDAAIKLKALNSFKSEENIELVVCTGDYTTLGLNHEYIRAAKVIQPLMDSPFGYVHVPGNHDYYANDVLRDDRFQSHFGETLQSNLPEYQVEGPWPLVRLIGENLCIIAVNSSRPNPIPCTQMERYLKSNSLPYMLFPKI